MAARDPNAIGGGLSEARHDLTARDEDEDEDNEGHLVDRDENKYLTTRDKDEDDESHLVARDPDSSEQQRTSKRVVRGGCATCKYV